MLSSGHRFIAAVRHVHGQFVPKHKKVTSEDVEVLQHFVSDAQKLVVLTGAGISTECGVPDYRSAEVGLYARGGYKPMTYQDFINRHPARQRYWLRSAILWNFMHNRRPGAAHLTLTDWERRGRLGHLITQNVDRLHHKAGTENVIELHGNLYGVRCVGCNYQTSRILFQKMLYDLNRRLFAEEAIINLMSNDRDHSERIRPDGDIDVNLEDITPTFRIPYCDNCQGILKPDVIFFGDNVKLELVQKIYKLIEDCSHLLVIGSSLQVFSSYRFVLHAHKSNKSILLLNIGSTRADTLAGVVRLSVKIGDILPQIVVNSN